MNEQSYRVVDRAVHIIAGLFLLALLLTDSPYKWWGLIGLIPLATATIKLCASHTLLGLSAPPSCKKR